MRTTILALTLLFSLTANATKPVCIPGFGALSEGTDPADVVSQTYKRLWDELGGNRLPADVIAALVKSEKPFDIPETEGKDLFLLRKRMKDFETMVNDAGWNTPKTRERLLSELGTQAMSVETAAEEQHVAVQRSAKPIEIEIGGNTIVAPDGKVLVLRKSDKAPRKVGASINEMDHSYDVMTGKVTTKKAGYQPVDGLIFSPDGKMAYFSTKDKVSQVPYANGFFNWAKGKALKGSKASREQLGLLTPTGRLVAGTEKHPREVFNLKSGKAETIDTSGLDLYKKGEPQSWTALPGTDEILLSAANEEKGELWVGKYTVGAAGELTPVGAAKKIKISEEGRFHAAPGGGTVLITDYKNALTLDPVTLDTRPLVKLRDNQNATVGWDGATLSPDGKTAYVLIDPVSLGRDDVRKTKDVMQIRHYDVATGKETNRTPLGLNAYYGPRMLPDGRLLLEIEKSDVKQIIYP